jgi:hypothetical protein
MLLVMLSAAGAPLQAGKENIVEEPKGEEPQGEESQGKKPQGEEPQGKGEIMRNAQMLVTSKGAGAMKYANHRLEKIRKAGNEHDIAFWEKIAAQVELLVEALPEDQQ